MGVYLPNMDMPTRCEYCNLCSDDGYCLAMGGYSLWDVLPDDADCFPDDWKYDGCPLVPVPPHGDLIDRHDLKNKEITIDYDEWDDTFEDGLLFVANLIDNAPTIIEEER